MSRPLTTGQLTVHSLNWPKSHHDPIHPLGSQRTAVAVWHVQPPWEGAGALPLAAQWFSHGRSSHLKQFHPQPSFWNRVLLNGLRLQRLRRGVREEIRSGLPSTSCSRGVALVWVVSSKQKCI
ncbi:hypothetical protein mRhiFer1_007982 [Rhinolophus ferrumequinum]|uniref:Uncharacterized protein n=1 Tax=Rhinolophus ferrumequinum TaxID=59479 RepID=A0A7J8AW53_RHIFE|nr:hypothetical protein mRhiFer1_007982 [Rhinolophus ferrumequinum]